MDKGTQEGDGSGTLRPTRHPGWRRAGLIVLVPAGEREANHLDDEDMLAGRLWWKRAAAYASAAFLALLAFSRLDPAVPVEAATPRNDLVGDIEFHKVRPEETLLDIARLHDLGYIELIAANPGMDPWIPGVGRTVILPTEHLLPDAPHKGIVINLSELRLYYFGDGSGPVLTFPIGIGREGRETPTGSTSIVAKRKDPVWVPPESIRAERPDLPQSIAPGPDNPLGKFAMNLGWTSYVIHGTNKPYGIGRRVSSGCIRMYPEDIDRLFGLVPLKTPVTVINDPVKLGWSRGELFLEVHPSIEEGDELEAKGWYVPKPIAGLDERVRQAAGAAADRIYWPAVRRAADAKRGIPVRITH